MIDDEHHADDGEGVLADPQQPPAQPPRTVRNVAPPSRRLPVASRRRASNAGRLVRDRLGTPFSRLLRWLLMAVALLCASTAASICCCLCCH